MVQCWQRLLTNVLGDMAFSSAVVYLDDVLLISKTFHQHCMHLQMMFDKLRKANLRLNGKKCNFAAANVKYLGHTLSKDRVSRDPAKTAAILGCTRPKNHQTDQVIFGHLQLLSMIYMLIFSTLSPSKSLTALYNQQTLQHTITKSTLQHSTLVVSPDTNTLSSTLHKVCFIALISAFELSRIRPNYTHTPLLLVGWLAHNS